MSVQINLNQPPFSFLSEENLEWLTGRLDLVFFPAGAVILDEGTKAPGVYIIFKGGVEERDVQGDQVFSQYGPDDLFDIRAVLESGSKHRYVAIEETLCYLLKANDFVELLQRSDDLSIYFHADLGTQQQMVETQDQSVAEFLLSRVDGDVIRTPVYVSGHTPLTRVATLMSEKKQDSLLVRHGKEVGIVTGTDLLKATLIEDKTRQTKVADIAQFNLIEVEQGDYLLNAMLKMTRYHIERVVVKRDGEIIGMLELMDMLSSFSTHSHLIAMRIEQAKNIKELVSAAKRIETLIETLNSQGIKMTSLTELITTLNRRLMGRAFELIFPERLHRSLCILVLGSEGRGEQILKTDQDNAVILQNEHDFEAVLPLLQQLHEVLLDFGYPRCPGGVMFINHAWVNSIEGWQDRVARWLDSSTPDAMMNMAIFMDAEVISGNAELLKPVKASWQKESLRSSIASARFAKAALQFETPLTFLGNIREDDGHIDIKKGGIFPLVHGVRALAFEQGIDECNTLERLDRLEEMKVLDSETIQGLRDSLIFFLRIRLRQQLEREAGSRGLSQQLDVKKLRSVDRNMLRHALQRVKKFKQTLTTHFHLENF
ncbi:MAG: putative nucleotidyltransferase substrate binding domain-containing protein [Oceanobacter sp.]